MSKQTRVAHPICNLYERLKAHATIVIVPSTVAETMQLGGVAGLTAHTMGLGQELATQQKQIEHKKQV